MVLLFGKHYSSSSAADLLHILIPRDDRGVDHVYLLIASPIFDRNNFHGKPPSTV